MYYITATICNCMKNAVNFHLLSLHSVNAVDLLIKQHKFTSNINSLMNQNTFQIIITSMLHYNNENKHPIQFISISK